MTAHNQSPMDEQASQAFKHVRRLAEDEVPHTVEPQRASTPPAFCGWDALELCTGRHPLSLTWLRRSAP